MLHTGSKVTVDATQKGSPVALFCQYFHTNVKCDHTNNHYHLYASYQCECGHSSHNTYYASLKCNSLAYVAETLMYCNGCAMHMEPTTYDGNLK
jgi:hypothetical protein